MSSQWRIYYGDGTVVEDDVSIEYVPTQDVQVILWKCEEKGWLTIAGYDYYVWQGVNWRGVDLFGLWDYLNQPGWRRVLFGRWAESRKYSDILDQALADRKKFIEGTL